MTDHITKIREALEAASDGAYLLPGCDVKMFRSLLAALDEANAARLRAQEENIDLKERAAKQHIEWVNRLEAAKKDARRYRWLREGRKGCYNTVMIYAGGALDAAVDAAIAAQEGGRENG